ncbi:unnamed protein product [Calypogeia fissa]
MAGRHRGRGKNYIPENEDSLESTARSRLHHPTVAYYRPRGYIPPSGGGRPQPYDDNYQEEEEEEDYEYRGSARESNDNPLYEVEDEDSRFPQPTASSRQGSPNNNPLYGNDPFKPSTTAAVCMTEFLRPKGGGGSPQGSSGHSVNARSGRKHKQFGNNVGNNFIIVDESTDDEEVTSSSSSSRRLRSPPPRQIPPPRRIVGKKLFRAKGLGDQMVVRYPPARFSPIMLPADNPSNPQSVCSPKGRRTKQQSSPGSTTSSGQNLLPINPPPPPQFTAPNIGDLIAAVRSDKHLLLGEVRKHTNREPRVPGDHDRYFAPRKGDIIIHFAPTLDDNKLLEYYDERKTMLRLQPGDKLVRVKYDNYKLPDHLMITSKLYLYSPEWVYLGKALQTIKTV